MRATWRPQPWTCPFTFGGTGADDPCLLHIMHVRKSKVFASANYLSHSLFYLLSIAHTYQKSSKLRRSEYGKRRPDSHREGGFILYKLPWFRAILHSPSLRLLSNWCAQVSKAVQVHWLTSSSLKQFISPSFPRLCLEALHLLLYTGDSNILLCIHRSTMQ